MCYTEGAQFAHPSVITRRHIRSSHENSIKVSRRFSRILIPVTAFTSVFSSFVLRLLATDPSLVALLLANILHGKWQARARMSRVSVYWKIDTKHYQTFFQLYNTGGGVCVCVVELNRHQSINQKNKKKKT